MSLPTDPRHQASDGSLPRLLIVAHAPSPNTQRMAQALVEGAQDPECGGVSVTLRSPFDTGPQEVRAASGVMLMTPENLGYMSGALKDFFDRIYYPCLEHTQGMPYALVVRAGHDGAGTVQAVRRIVTGLRWRAAAEPLVCRGDFQERFVAQCRELGMAMAAGLATGVL